MYAAGFYGNPPAPIDPEAMDRMMASPQWAEVVANPPEEPTIEELRSRYGTTDDDELFLRFLVPETDLDAMRAAGPVKRHFPLASPEVDQVLGLLKAVDTPYVRVTTEQMDLELRKSL